MVAVSMIPSDARKTRVAVRVIMASHNRRKTTLESLNRLKQAMLSANVNWHLTLFDDGSKDGTAVAVMQEYPDACVINGTGEFFWARSMASAERIILNESAPHDNSWILWLNDDVMLDNNALERSMRISHANPHAIIVGATRDPSTGVPTYGGLIRRGAHPLSFKLRVDPCLETSVDTFNGNFVLVPVPLAFRLDGIDGTFAHGYADIDYGIRASKAGIRTIQLSGTVGTCPRNLPTAAASIIDEWRRYLSPKGGGDYRSLKTIYRTTSPSTWPLLVLLTYTTWWIRVVVTHTLKALGC